MTTIPSHDDLLQEVELALDKTFASIPLPHANRTLAIWYLLSVAEDTLRMLFVRDDVSPVDVEFYIDRMKFSLRYGLDRIFKETTDTHVKSVPRPMIPMLYSKASALLGGGIDFALANQVCAAAHAGTARLIDSVGKTHLELDESHHDFGYAALERMGHEESGSIDFASLFYLWVRHKEVRPNALNRIVNAIGVRGGQIVYTYDQRHAVALADEMQQPELLIPNGWEFQWGGTHETRLLTNALSIRCLYHLIAVHFGAIRLGLRGVGASSLCLILSREKLAQDIALMSSLPRHSIDAYIEFLTFGRNSMTPDPALQPLLEIGGEFVAIPCIHYLSSNRERNLLSLQARIQKPYFDSRSNLFERNMIDHLVQCTRDRWPYSRPNVEVTVDGSAEEIDLLIADPSSQLLLICELRWMLQPGDPREVINRKAECTKKVDQLHRKVSWAESRADGLVRKVFPELTTSNGRPWSVRGVVVIETFGGCRSRRPELPILTSAVFALGVQRSKSLQQFVEWSKSLIWLPQEKIHFVISPVEIKVGSKCLKIVGMKRLQGAEKYREYLDKTLIC